MRNHVTKTAYFDGAVIQGTLGPGLHFVRPEVSALSGFPFTQSASHGKNHLAKPEGCLFALGTFTLCLLARSGQCKRYRRLKEVAEVLQVELRRSSRMKQSALAGESGVKVATGNVWSHKIMLLLRT